MTQLLMAEPCEGVILSEAARRSILVGGGGAPLVQKIGGGGAAWAVKFSNSAYLFKQFFSKEFLLSGLFQLKTNYHHQHNNILY